MFHVMKWVSHNVSYSADESTTCSRRGYIFYGISAFRSSIFFPGLLLQRISHILSIRMKIKDFQLVRFLFINLDLMKCGQK